MQSPEKPPVVLIAGPTASGKSDVAIKLAQRLEQAGKRGVVVNADSQQVYGDLRILSARPTEDEMGGVEHRLFGTWDGAQACSAADWAKTARHEIADLHDRGAVPILCGGTGLYLRTLLDGIAPVPEIDDNVRGEIRNLSTSELRECLAIEDPQAASRLGPRDVQRMSRALEVIRSTGHPLHYWQQRKTGGIGSLIDLYPLIVLPERGWLYERCSTRFESMLRRGAIEEVQKLLNRDLDPNLPIMRAIGVPEIRDYLHSGLDGDGLLVKGSIATHQYAKRQYTWFRNQPPSDWARVDNKTIAEYDFTELFLRDDR